MKHFLLQTVIIPKPVRKTSSAPSTPTQSSYLKGTFDTNTPKTNLNYLAQGANRGIRDISNGKYPWQNTELKRPILEAVAYMRPTKKPNLPLSNGATPWFQQGGTVAESGAGQDVQQQVVALVQAAMQGDQQAQQQVQQIMQAAQQGDPQAQQLAQMIQQVAQAIQQQTRSQKIGGKLAYIHRLRTNGTNLDEEVIYEKCGGKMTKKVVKKNNHGGNCPTAKKFKAKEQKYFECGGGKVKRTSNKFFTGGNL